MESVFTNKRDCCGCGVCREVCPTKAISLVVDEYGYMYPKINNKKCINCKKCKNHCPMTDIENNKVINTYAAVCTNEELKKKSASGGVFAALAQKYINRGAIVCGAAIYPKENIVAVKHICIDNLNDLDKIQGSKYVQSDISEIIKEVKKYLNQGREVLFSGTPCQVEALNKYLNKKYDKLITVDLICHGTPSPSWWEESLKLLSEDLGGSIIGVSFRDSDKWMQGHVSHVSHVGHVEISNYSRDNVYYDLFLKGESFRESCYSCPFANDHRVGDLTIGDFWGFAHEHDVDSIEKEFGIKLNQGLSCIITNTEKGQIALEDAPVWIYLTDFNKACKYNPQLNRPSSVGKNRKLLLFLYKYFGYKIVNMFCEMKIRIWKRIQCKKEKI